MQVLRRCFALCLLILLLGCDDGSPDPTAVSQSTAVARPSPTRPAGVAGSPTAVASRPPVVNPTLAVSTASSTTVTATTAISPTASLPTATAVAAVLSPTVQPTAQPTLPPYTPQAVPAARRFLYVTSGGTLRLRDVEGLVDKPVSAAAAFGVVDYRAEFSELNLIRWSPDGRYLCYANAAIGGLDVVDVEKALATDVEDALIHVEASGVNQAAWSGDSRYLALAVAGPESGYSLQVVDASSDQPLTNAPTGGLRDFAWSPTAPVLAYSAPVGGAELGPPFGEVYTVTLVGSAVTTPTLVSRDGLNPQWSPDGRLLAYWQAQALGGDNFDFNVRVVSPGGQVQDLGGWNSSEQPDFAPIRWRGGYVYANLALDGDGRPLDDLWSYRNGAGRVLNWSRDARENAGRVAVADGRTGSASNDLQVITLPGSELFNVSNATLPADAEATPFEAAWSASSQYLAFNVLINPTDTGGSYRTFIQRLGGDFAPRSIGKDLYLTGWGQNASGAEVLVAQNRLANTFFTAIGPDFRLRAIGEGVALGWQPVR